MRLLVLFFAGALLNRLRGDELIGNILVSLGYPQAQRDDVAWVGRLLLALGFGGAVWWTQPVPWWLALACGGVLFAAFSRPHKALNDFGAPLSTAYQDAVVLTALFAMPTAFALAAYAGFTGTLGAASWVELALAVVTLIGPFTYWVAYRIPVRLAFLASGIPLGEALFGGLLFTALGV